jgi:NADH-quinone oxidoreductase subunit M
MSFAMAGTFLASDGLLYYIFWELALIPIYFIALIWGNGDTEERKKAVVKFFIYTWVLYVSCFCLFVSKSGKLY